jgi:hypothetical protein
LNEIELEQKLSEAGREYARENPGYVAQVFWWNSTRILLVDDGREFNRFALGFQGIGRRPADAATYAWYVVALLALAGLVLARRALGPWWFWITPVLLFVTVVVISSNTRYRLPIEPFVVVLAAYALVGAIERIRHRSAPRQQAQTQPQQR